MLDGLRKIKSTCIVASGDRVLDVLHGEHDAQVTEGVYRSRSVIGNSLLPDSYKLNENALTDSGTAVFADLPTHDRKSLSKLIVIPHPLQI
jgi:hypothetical protein